MLCPLDAVTLLTIPDVQEWPGAAVSCSKASCQTSSPCLRLKTLKQRRQLMKVKEISLQHFYLTLRISCLLLSISGYFLAP